MRFFPHDNIREFQDKLVQDIGALLKKGGILLANAPTGIGKTAGVLSPALEFALSNKKKVFFLTTKHTQHKIVIDTLKRIRERCGEKFVVVDLIGRKWMCSIPGVKELSSSDFSELCKTLMKNGTCTYKNNTIEKKNRERVFEILKYLEESPRDIEEVLNLARSEDYCAYILITLLLKSASVIIGDYNHILHPVIRDNLFSHAEIGLTDCILVFDEGHNLPDRVRELMSAQVSNLSVGRAMKEAKEFDEKVFENLSLLNEFLNITGRKVDKEKVVSREWLIQEVERISSAPLTEFVLALEKVAEKVREKKRNSYCGSVASFFENWMNKEKEFVRIFKREEFKGNVYFMVENNCLDPSILTKKIFEGAYSTIVMSGTLQPLQMFADLFGISNALLISYKSPFPKKNKLTIIVPKTTTKYSKRNDEQFKCIAEECSKVVNLKPVNAAIFFPSYYVRDRVLELFKDKCEKTIFVEQQELSKFEKLALIQKFQDYSKSGGAVLLGVLGANYSEGFDYPDNVLKIVMIVGIPLAKPDLYNKALINFFDNKYGKGWFYGYTYPAINKALQAAGRPIRSSSDRGVIIFMDERYIWDSYLLSLPEDAIVTKKPEERIIKFFS